MFDVWHDVLLNPDHVRVFNYNDEVVWSDNRGFGRVPPPLVGKIDPGNVYKITEDGAEVTMTGFDPLPGLEVLEKIEAKARVKMDSDIEATPSREIQVKSGVIVAREYKTASKGDLVLINTKLHTVLLSAVRRGADLFTTSDRSLVAAKIDGAIVAMAAAIKVNADLL